MRTDPYAALASEHREVVDTGFPTPCWLWKRAKTTAGYGELFLYRTVQYAHRLAWEMEHGELPERMQVHHLCEQRSCVNPDHLHAIDIAEHQRLHRTKVKPEDVVAMVAARQAGEKTRLIAQRYGISHAYAADVIRRGRAGRPAVAA